MLTTATNSANLCLDCGSPIAPASPEGLCPRCLAFSAIGSAFTANVSVEALSSLRFFGDYELIQELGRGGSGVVFKARQFGVNRTVALKLLAGGAAAGRDFVHRFHTEAAAAAQLEHPNIVSIYEFGEHQGAHFLAMRYLEGGTLQSRITREHPTPEQAARWLISIAAPVEHAHRHGILHRDLKPANVLLDCDGTPYVADFGLARVLERESSLTLSHAVLGTIAYLAPEVATGGAAAATIAGDVYGLGAILYELLTGRPPFAGVNPVATMREVAEQEPAPPHIHNSAVPPDLETICLKCLEKDSAKRYATAQQLAEDLDRFLKNEPIHARPISGLARAWRWCQRKPALASSLFLILILILILIIGSPLAALRINQARKAEAAARHRAEQNLYAADMLLTQNSLAEQNVARAVELLNKYLPSQDAATDQRGWEWHYYLHQTLGEEKFILGQHPQSVTAVGLLPDGKTVWSSGWDKTVRLWNLDSRTEIARLNHDRAVLSAAQSPDGRWLATVTIDEGYQKKPQPVLLWDLSTRQTVAVLATNFWPRQTMTFSPDGRLLAFADIAADGIHLVEVKTRQEIAFLPVSFGTIAPVGLAFAPNSKTFAYSPDRTGLVILWDIQAKTNLAVLRGHTDISLALAFSPDGSRLASGSLDRSLRLWNLAERREELVLTNYAKEFWQLRFLKDGERLAVLDERQQLRFLSTKTGEIIRELRGHQNYINGLALSPDEKLIITGSEDRTVRVWDAEPSPSAKVSQSLPPGVLVTPNHSHAIRLSPDGRQLIAVFTNGTFVVWDTLHFSPSPNFSLPTKDVVQLALAPGGKLAAFAFDLGSNRVDYVVWDVERNQPKFVALQGTASMSGRIRFSQDGRKMALGAMSHLYVFDVSSGRQTHQLPYEQNNEPDLVGGLAFSRDARWVTAATHLGWVHVWDLQATESKRVFRPGKFVLSGAVFSRDARMLVIASGYGTFSFDLQRGEQLPSLNPKPSHARAPALSPDGKTLALAENDTITLWNIESRQLVGKLSGHQRELRDLAFTPDGKTLVSAAYDEYRLWRTGETGITNQNNAQP